MNICLEAGIARKDITPDIGGQLFGYRPDVFSESVSDNLTVTAIALYQGDVTVMLISAAVGIFQTELSDKIRTAVTAETGVRHVLLSATHTHSGPNTAGLTGWGDVDSAYCDSILIPRTIEAAKEAVCSLKAVTLGIGTVKSHVGVNRRQHNIDGTISLGQNPWGVLDDTMTVLRFSEPCGKSVVNLVHYGCHCTAAGINTEITGDWAGVMLDRLETESGVPAVFINGAAGDIGPRLSNGQTIGDINYAHKLGGVAALDAVEAWKNAKHSRTVNLTVTAGELILPVKSRMPYHEAQKRLDELAENSMNIDAQKWSHYKDITDACNQNLPEETHLILPQILIALGDVVFVPFRFELFAEISLRMRKHSPFVHTLCMGYTNGFVSYLPSQDQLCLGGYEIDMFKTSRVQPLADNTDDNIIKENLTLIKSLKERN